MAWRSRVHSGRVFPPIVCARPLGKNQGAGQTPIARRRQNTRSCKFRDARAPRKPLLFQQFTLTGATPRLPRPPWGRPGPSASGGGWRNTGTRTKIKRSATRHPEDAAHAHAATAALGSARRTQRGRRRALVPKSGPRSGPMRSAAATSPPPRRYAPQAARPRTRTTTSRPRRRPLLVRPTASSTLSPATAADDRVLQGRQTRRASSKRARRRAPPSRARARSTSPPRPLGARPSGSGGRHGARAAARLERRAAPRVGREPCCTSVGRLLFL